MVEDAIEFMRFSKVFLTSNQSGAEYIYLDKLVEVDYLNDIKVANGYQLFMIENQPVKYLCLNLFEQESIEVRLAKRQVEPIKP